MRNLSFAILALSAACGSVTGETAKEDQPSISTLSPDHGPIDGGAMITLTGTNLNGSDVIVLVGGHAATNVMATSATMLTFELPAGEQEGATVEVTVANSNGFGTKAAAFRYTYRPVILSITPGNGKAAGGTPITITGRGFQNDDAGLPTITIAGGAATNIQVVDDKTIMAVTGATAPGTKAFTPVDVEVENANGMAVLPKRFQVSAPGLIATEGFCCPTNGMRIFHIDPTNGRFATIGTTTQRFHGCALGPNGKLFAIGGRLPGGTGKCNLITFDPLTGEVTPIGPLSDGTLAHCPNQLAFIGNNLYGIDTETMSNGTTGTNRVLSIIPATGAVTVVGTAPMAVQRASSIAVKDATSLYYADASSGGLDTIAVATSTLTPGPNITGALTTNRLKSMTSVGATYYVAERSGSPASLSNVYSLNVTNGALTKVAAVQGSIVSLCPTPPSF